MPQVSPARSNFFALGINQAQAIPGAVLSRFLVCGLMVGFTCDLSLPLYSGYISPDQPPFYGLGIICKDPLSYALALSQLIGNQISSC